MVAKKSEVHVRRVYGRTRTNGRQPGAGRPDLAARAHQGRSRPGRMVQGGRSVDGVAQVVQPRSGTVRKLNPPPLPRGTETTRAIGRIGPFERAGQGPYVDVAHRDETT